MFFFQKLQHFLFHVYQSQLRDPLEVCYSWAAMARADLQLDSLSDDEKFWEAGASLVRSLRAPAEVYLHERGNKYSSHIIL